MHRLHASADGAYVSELHWLYIEQYRRVLMVIVSLYITKNRHLPLTTDLLNNSTFCDIQGYSKLVT
jgi:hypothetical protein